MKQTMRNFISYKKSIQILENLTLNTLSTQKLFITNALHKVIANDVIANHNNPEFKTSAMDGYAIKYDDIDSDFIEIIDKNPAGFIVESQVSSKKVLKLLQVH